MREFVKHTVYSMLFLAGLLVLLILTSILVAPKNNTKEAGILEPQANAILTEPENTIDVLYLGDSESQTSINPAKLWEKRGITLYSCGTSGQKLCETLEFLDKAFQKQTPKLVVLETNCIFTVFSAQDTVRSKAERILPVIRYHDRWKSLNTDDWKLAFRYTYKSKEKGYKASNIVAPASENDYMAQTEEEEPIPGKSMRYLGKIKELCEKKKAGLLLLSTPSSKNWNRKKHNSIRKYAEEMKIAYIDTNLMQEQVPIDWNRDTRDKGDHLNDTGAEKVTDYMGEYLSDTGLFTNHHGDSKYSHWN